MVILVVALLVLGPQRLPEVARSVGRGMRELKDSLSSSATTMTTTYADDVDDDSPTPPSRSRRRRITRRTPDSRTPSASSCSIGLL